MVGFPSVFRVDGRQASRLADCVPPQANIQHPALGGKYIDLPLADVAYAGTSFGQNVTARYKPWLAVTGGTWKATATPFARRSRCITACELNHGANEISSTLNEDNLQ